MIGPLFSAVIFWFLVGLVRTATALPAGFEDEDVVSVDGVVDIAFASNVLLAVGKDGYLYTFDLEDPNAERQTAADLTIRVCSNGERGLATVTVHPQFETNRWVYLYYTYNRDDPNCDLDESTGAVNRCARFTMNDDWTLDMESELVLFQSTPLPDKIHNGGDMEFGVDGMLYVTTGDAGQHSDQWSQKRHNLQGKIIRITDAGDIPDDNPFTGDGTARCNEAGKTEDDLICQEIFAYGLRNPFRFTMDPHSADKVRFLVSDVGASTWEEISVGGTDYAGANYGWPILEGPCEHGSEDSCSIGEQGSPYNDPLFWYEHNEENEACAVGVAVPPSGSGWPSPYSDSSSFFFIDFIFGKIIHVTEDPEQACNTCVPPVHGFKSEDFHDWPRPIGLKFGPVGLASSSNTASVALYYTFREGSNYVKRIIYTGGTNFAPVAAFSATPTVAQVDETIVFDASATTDADHSTEELTFSWNFGDDSPEETGMIVSHQYVEAGVYQVTLTAVDPEGTPHTTSSQVTIGAPPTLEIISPVENTTFAVGDVLTLVGAGVDHLGNQLDEATQLSWEVRQHHANHFHPYLDQGTFGNNFAISEAPEPEDFFAASNSYLEVLLTGTDADGISSTVSRKVMPRTVYLDFDTEPTGLQISLDEEILTMPQKVLTWENHKLKVVVPFPQNNYTFVSWMGGESPDGNGVIVVPALSGTVPKYVAKFIPLAEPPSVASGDPPIATPITVPAVAPTPLTPTKPLDDPSGATDPEVEGVEVVGDSGAYALFPLAWIVVVSINILFT